jgi:hypothetical protein
MRPFPPRAVLLGAIVSALVLGGITGPLAAGASTTGGVQVAADPGPSGDFAWKGLNWRRRTSAESWGPAYNKRYEAANVVGPDSRGYITLKVTNPDGRSPVSAEFSTTRGGFGYGTYTTVVEKRLDVMQPELVWGCLFTYDAASAPGYTEIDVCEASAWGGGQAQNEPVVQAHGYWFDATKAPGQGSVASVFPAGSASVHTHRMVWAPQKLTYETYAGHGFGGALLKRTELTGSRVPVPTREKLHFNFWVFGGNGGTPDRVKPETVVIRDFSFTPAGSTTAPPPTSEPTPAQSSAGGVRVAGDWNGDGRTTAGVFRDGRWELSNELGNRVHVTASFGRAGDIPVVGDWNGDGRDGIGVVRGSRWLLRNRASTGAADRSFHYGRADRGDVPIVGDWNGNGRAGIGIIRDGEWHLRNSLSGGAGQIVFTYGRITRGDRPLIGDWNGDGRTGIGIVRGREWHLRNSLSGGPAQIQFIYGRVTDGDQPLMGDWSRDGRSTPAIVRTR